MNKLRLIKIYELRKQIHPIEQIVIDLLDGIEKVLDGNIIRYWKDGKRYFSYNSKTNSFWINHHKEYYIIKCSSEERMEIMKYLLEKHLKLEINNIL